jgi:putative Holliday junction resolvase
MAAESVIGIEDLPPRLTPGSRLLGLDLGTKTIGLALSDVTCSIATPLTTIARTKFSNDLKTLTEHIDQHDVSALIIGLPLHLDGSEGRSAQSARAFAGNLARTIALPIVFWDERLSTVAVERTLLEADTSRKRRKEVVDKMAAAFILQGALDRLRNMR